MACRYAFSLVNRRLHLACVLSDVGGQTSIPKQSAKGSVPTWGSSTEGVILRVGTKGRLRLDDNSLGIQIF